MKIKKNELRYAVDTLLFLCVVGMVLIGTIIGILMPEGPSTQPGDKYFWNLHRHQWGKIHLYLSFTFTALLVVHLILSWKWITNQARNLFKKGWIPSLVLTVLASFLILFFFWQFTPKHAQKYGSYGKGQEGEGRVVYITEQEKATLDKDLPDSSTSIEVTGQMTLRELSNTTGITMQAILGKLELPDNTPPEQTLGRLRNMHGFSLADVREVVSLLLEETLPVKNEDQTVKHDVIPEVHVGQDDHDDTDKFTRGRLAEDKSVFLIVGNMTFREIESETGIPVESIVQALGLPGNVPLDETLGRLRKRYGFTIQDVRDFVSSYLEKKGTAYE